METLYQHAFGDCHVGTREYWLGVLKEQLEFEEDEKLSCMTPEELFEYYVQNVTLCEAVRAELKPRSKNLFISWYFDKLDDGFSCDRMPYSPKGYFESLEGFVNEVEKDALLGKPFILHSCYTYSGNEETFTFYDEDFFWDEPEE